MKQLFRFSLMLLAFLLPATVTAHDFEVDGIYYKINGNGATIASCDYQYTGDLIIPDTIIYDGIAYTITAIGDGAFFTCGYLTSITIPNSVITIGNSAFTLCASLKSISFGNSVQSIGDDAFAATKLTSVTIPGSVTSIGNRVFDTCDSLSVIVVASDNAKYDSRNNCNAIIETATNTLIMGCKNTTIPNSVIYIGNDAFAGCYTLLSISIPSSVVSIGSGALKDCNNLESIIVADENQYYDSRNNCNALIQTSSNTLLIGCKNSVIPNSIKTIGDHAFQDCCGLTSISIPNSVSSIGEEAFESCGDLTNITIGNSVTGIGVDAFYNCYRLNNVYCYVPNPSMIAMMPSVFACYNDINITDRTLYVPEGSLSAYQASDKWTLFGTILEMVHNGDVNDNGNVSIDDVTDLIDYLLGRITSSINAYNGDVSGDGDITISDVTALIDILLRGY